MSWMDLDSRVSRRSEGKCVGQETEVKEVVVILCTASPPETLYCCGMACDLSKDVHPTSGWPRDPVLSSKTAAEN